MLIYKVLCYDVMLNRNYEATLCPFQFHGTDRYCAKFFSYNSDFYVSRYCH